MVMDVVEDSDCRKIFEYPFSTSDLFFGGAVRSPKTNGGLFFIQKSKHHRASHSSNISNMVKSELLRFPLTSSRCSYSLDPCEEDEIREVR